MPDVKVTLNDVPVGSWTVEAGASSIRKWIDAPSNNTQYIEGNLKIEYIPDPATQTWVTARSFPGTVVYFPNNFQQEVLPIESTWQHRVYVPYDKKAYFESTVVASGSNNSDYAYNATDGFYYQTAWWNITENPSAAFSVKISGSDGEFVDITLNRFESPYGQCTYGGNKYK